jgi:hypothetical protein
MSPDPSDSKSRRRPAVKPMKRQGDKPVKKGFYLSLDAARRLGVTATMEDRDESGIVDELIRTHLRKYVVHVRGDRGTEEGASDVE